MTASGSMSTSTGAATGNLGARWGHLPALDGLRGLSVMGVLFFHAGHLSGGFLGVDAFFALSGFLITTLLIREAERSSRIDLVGFWGRRLRRLLPAVVVLLVVTMLWARWFGSSAEWDGVRRDGPWAQAYLANWNQIASSDGYWDSFASPPLLGHLWSLAIEEQFYVVWPVVVAMLWRWIPRPQIALLAVSLAGIGASVLTMILLYDGGDPTRVYMGTDTRASSILVGVAAATAPASRLWTAIVNRWRTLADGVIVAGLVVLAWMWWSVDGSSAGSLYRGGLALHSTLTTVIVALVAHRSLEISTDSPTASPTPSGTGRGVITRALGWRPLVMVGTLSYSLYLWHWPVYAVMSPERTGWSGWDLTGARLGVSTVLAVASYALVERQVRFEWRWAHGRQGRWAFATSMLALGAFWVATPLPRTEIAGFDPTTITLAPTTPSTPTTVTTPATNPNGTSPSPTPDPTPTSPEPSVTASVAPTTTTLPVQFLGSRAMWHGDSIAFDASLAVLAALNASGVATDTIAFPGIRLTEYEDGRDRFALMIERIEEWQPDVFIHQLSVWDAGRSDAEQLEALDTFWSILDERGIALVIVTAPVVTEELSDPGMARLVDATTALASRHPDRILVLDQTPVFGDEFERDVDGDGIPERKPDGVHLCPSGAARIAAWLLESLAPHLAALDPQPPEVWATGDWVTDIRYDDPRGACSSS